MNTRPFTTTQAKTACLKLGREALLRSNSATEPNKKLAHATEALGWFEAAYWAEEEGRDDGNPIH